MNLPFTIEEFRAVLLLETYNTRLVVLSTLLLGISSGLVGGFLLLRKRSLFGDVLSHATLPGIGLAFAAGAALGSGGKQLGVLLAGAAASGLAGVGVMMFILRKTRLRDDAAMGLVLGVFFGIGIAILRMVQSLPGSAGLESFIYGKTASMVMTDFCLIAGISVVAAGVALLISKELTLLCFDENYAASTGWPVVLLDGILLLLVTAVTVIGLQAVGLILVIALLIIPAAAARFWTERLSRMLWISALIGGLSGWLGASLSALFAKLPSGALIVLTASGIFIISMIFGSARGIAPRWSAASRLKRRVGRQHLLRAAYEILEQRGTPVKNGPLKLAELVAHRSWTMRELGRLLRLARREDHLEATEDRAWIHLSESGFGEAARITRNHRLWELYLIHHADIAPSHVDRDADMVEHILGAEMVRSLESELEPGRRIPESPHQIKTP
ncbi:MAG: iron chelate uptake ABC transporter family permease subunit [Verrucomicrobiota bacterium]